MTTRGDLCNAIRALKGLLPETMHRSIGTINHVLVQADLAKNEVAESSLDPEAVLVLNLVLRIVELESKVEISAGREGISNDRIAALFSEFR